MKLKMEEESVWRKVLSCINNYSVIEISDSECNNTSKNHGTEMEHSSILKENSIPKPQINTDVNQDKEAALEMSQSDDVPPLPATNGEQVGIGSHCIIVKVEIHDY